MGLHSSAVINLKKSPGSHVANEPAIYPAAGADCELLRKQWALYVAVSLFAEAALDPIFVRAR